MHQEIVIRYTDKAGIAHEKQSVTTDAPLYLRFVYASTILQGWNIQSLTIETL